MTYYEKTLDLIERNSFLDWMKKEHENYEINKKSFSANICEMADFIAIAIKDDRRPPATATDVDWQQYLLHETYAGEGTISGFDLAWDKYLKQLPDDVRYLL
jgi:hypothetical protein